MLINKSRFWMRILNELFLNKIPWLTQNLRMNQKLDQRDRLLYLEQHWTLLFWGKTAHSQFGLLLNNNSNNENNENNLFKWPNDLYKVTPLEWSFRKILPLRPRLLTKQYYGKFWVFHVLLVSCGRYRSERKLNLKNNTLT
jgi:hypothetical protein